MKKYLYFLTVFILSNIGFSQKYEFKTIKDIEATPVISQGSTGTCWSFSSTSFLEAEITRISGKHIDLSEMYNVRHTYDKKAMNYVMRQGKAQFGEGGLSHDVINSAREFGLVPQTAFLGKLTTSSEYNHLKMAVELEDVVKKVVADVSKMNTSWKIDYSAILDNYMGKNVTEFTFEGKTFTPQYFLEYTKLNLDDYVTITSFNHEPNYSKFILNIPDNFANGSFYNLPLDEFIQNIDHAIENGYTVALDTDVSEKTFSGKVGIAVIPEIESDEVNILNEIKPEKNITTEFRQQEFENYNTTDDHLMHIVGKIKDQKGNIYYKVKNSWGKESGKDGFVYMSIPYLRLKAISVLLHKNALMDLTKANLKL